MNAKENHANQSELIEKHTETVDWLSSSILWKSELQDLQKMLDERSAFSATRKNDVDADHFQLMIRHNIDEIEKLRNKLRNDETMLAKLMESKDGSITVGSDEHTNTMRQVESFSKAYRQFRKEFLEFALKTKGHEG
jgi:hypothetical protein